MSGSVMWKELTAEELRANAAADAIVVLPVGSMEQHGPHLPVGVDTILTEGVCRAGAEAAAGDVAVVVAPTVWCGMAEHHMAFGGKRHSVGSIPVANGARCPPASTRSKRSPRAASMATRAALVALRARRFSNPWPAGWRNLLKSGKLGAPTTATAK
jgi:Creatinine amidohydrolase